MAEKNEVAKKPRELNPKAYTTYLIYLIDYFFFNYIFKNKILESLTFSTNISNCIN